jgi:hypothetical protein
MDSLTLTDPLNPPVSIGADLDFLKGSFYRDHTLLEKRVFFQQILTGSVIQAHLTKTFGRAHFP